MTILILNSCLLSFIRKKDSGILSPSHYGSVGEI